MYYTQDTLRVFKNVMNIITVPVPFDISSRIVGFRKGNAEKGVCLIELSEYDFL